MKIGIRVLAVVLLLSGMADPARAAEPQEPAVPVTIGNHADFSRIVFAFPKLIAYHVTSTESNVRLDFDTTARAVFSGKKSALVKTIKPVPNGDGLLKVEIALTEGATVKSYRLYRKIVVDVHPSGAMPKPPAPKAAEKKAETPPPPPAIAAPKAVEIVKEAAPTPLTTAPPPAAEITADQLKAAIAHPETLAPAAPSKGATAPPLASIVDTSADAAEDDDERDNPTKIYLSFLAPSRLAAFERSSTSTVLWIVTDQTTVTAALPVVTGTMAKFIAPPKTLKFNGGVAYRFVLPKKLYPHIKKQNLSWKMLLLSAPPEPAPPADIKVAYDPASRQGKMIVPLNGAGGALTFEDPDIGDTLYVIPTDKPDQAVQDVVRLADFAIVPAMLGMVVRPLRDNIKATPVRDFVFLTSPDGLIITPEGVGTPVLIGEADAAADNDNNRLFDFPNWRQGGFRMLGDNKQKLQDAIVAAKSPDERTGLLMKMAMLYFSNNFGPETLGILDLVLSENPDMDKNPDFIAIRGAANAMSGRFKEAFQYLSYPPIQQHPEVNLWIGFAAAATEQWHMADRSFPKSNRLLLQYPDNIAIPFTIYMAESALHIGRTDTAKKLLDTINLTSDAMDPQYRAAIAYLRGETFSQEGKPDKAAELWQPVANGLDRLYHTKAMLALTGLLLQQKKIPLKEAIDRIDSLRFAWRGDGLEIEVLRRLGALKVQNNQVLSGLEDMKQAADLSDSILDDSIHIRDEMRRIFSDLYVGNQASKIPPLEAVSVFNEFGALLPPGPEGVTATLDFVNYLIHIDLLDTAASIIEEQIKIGLPQEKLAGIGTRLAAVYLLDGKPLPALEALKKTETSGLPTKAAEERSLLQARAQSQLRQTAAAISTLSVLNSKNARRLKADVLWRAEDWNAAASAIESVLSDAGSPLGDEDAQLVVNAAVAWKLAGNRDKLKELKTKYETVMATTKLASTFGVVTRDGGISTLADRDSLIKIAGEVDMFRGFLDTYKAGAGKGS